MSANSSPLPRHALALFAAEVGRAKVSFVIAAYAVLIAGALAFNALGLLISLLTVRGSHGAAILFLLVLLLVGASQGDGGIGTFRLGSVSPFFAAVVSCTTATNGVLFSQSADPVTSGAPAVAVGARVGAKQPKCLFPERCPRTPDLLAIELPATIHPYGRRPQRGQIAA